MIMLEMVATSIHPPNLNKPPATPSCGHSMRLMSSTLKLARASSTTAMTRASDGGGEHGLQVRRDFPGGGERQQLEQEGADSLIGVVDTEAFDAVDCACADP